MADRVADQVDEDLDDGAFLAAWREAASPRSSSIADVAASSAERIEHDDGFAGERREIDRAMRLGRLLAHRREHRQQMPRGGCDVVAVARIIAAERPVGALDDALGAFDDPVERRAQHLVERVVECG